MRERGANRWPRALAGAIPALALLFILALAAGCSSQVGGEIGQAPPTAVPVAIEPAADPSEGVAATGEPGAEASPAGAQRAAPLPAPTAGPAPTGVDSQPAALPATAGPRKRVVVLDPGHGGPESGASAVGLAEKDVNLEIALRLAELLRSQGYEVALTRDADRAVSPEFTGGGYPGVGKDLQARIDIANAAGADLFISIHNNGSADPDESGTEVWYNKERPFSERNQALAGLVQENLRRELAAIGYNALDRGIKDDSNFRIFRGRAYNLYVLGPGTGPRPHVATQMPGVLGESLFISNPADAAMLRRERTRDAIAAGYRDAIVAYFERYPHAFSPAETGSRQKETTKE